MEDDTQVAAKDAAGAVGFARVQRKTWLNFPRRHPLLAVIVLLAAAGATYWFTKGSNEPTTKPLIATVTVGNIENTVTAAGSLQPRNFVDVGAQVSGQLEKLFVEVGDVVEQGQLLAQIDASVQAQRVAASKASLDALEAQLASRQASLKLAEANAARQEMLMEEDATSQQEFDNAQNSLVSARSSLRQLQAQIEQSRASLASDEAQLGYSKIYAPKGGTVVSINLKEGQTLNATQQAPTVLRIADLSMMTVETNVSEADVGKLTKGMDVYFTTLGGGNRRWYGKLRQILPTPTITNNVVLYTALFDVNNNDGALLPSMTAQVFFVTSSARNVLTVPMGALTFTGTAEAGDGSTSPRRGGNFDPANLPPEMAERLRQMRAARQNGGQSAGNFNPNDIPPEIRERFRNRNGGQGGFGQFAQQATQQNGGVRTATVKRINDKGETEIREVKIGVTSRVSAEIISGLQEGDQVVAGILQPINAEQQNNNNFRGPGGFRMMIR